MTLPSEISTNLDNWLATHQPGSLRDNARALSEGYRKGHSSGQTDIATYLTTRVPATFAANQRAMAQLQEVIPNFAPSSLLDLGAGPGTATWAAHDAWPSLSKITLCERDNRFADVAAKLNAVHSSAALRTARILRLPELQLPRDETADLVLSSYMLAEMPLPNMAEVAGRIWARTNKILLLIEPGTPQGFARLRAIRDHLLKQGAKIIAPCTHQLSCPMHGEDWCHFKVRLQRSREHMHAKAAVVPFEDEPFSYLALSREAVAHNGARILARPNIAKVQASLRLCADGEVSQQLIAVRDKAGYKRAKKALWGDLWKSL